jgi:hypothetical protein
MRNAFADELTKIGSEDARIVLLSGDIGNRLFDKFRERHSCTLFQLRCRRAEHDGSRCGYGDVWSQTDRLYDHAVRYYPLLPAALNKFALTSATMTFRSWSWLLGQGLPIRILARRITLARTLRSCARFRT